MTTILLHLNALQKVEECPCTLGQHPCFVPVNHEEYTPGLSCNPSNGGSIVAIKQHMGRKWTNVTHL